MLNIKFQIKYPSSLLDLKNQNLDHHYKTINSFAHSLKISTGSFNKDHLIRFAPTHQINDKLYVSKLYIDWFSNNYVAQSDAIKILKVNLVIFEKSLSALGITKVRLSAKKSYIRKIDVELIMNHIKNHSLFERQKEWVRATYILKNQKYSVLAKSQETIVKACKLGHMSYFYCSSNHLHIEKNSLENYLNVCKELDEEYLTIIEATKMLGKKQFNRTLLNQQYIPNLIDALEKNHVKIKNFKTPIKNEYIYIHKDAFYTFLQKHISKTDIAAKYKIEPKNLNYVIRKLNLSYYFLVKNVELYSRKDIEERLLTSLSFQTRKEGGKDFLQTNYYTLQEVKALLKLSDSELSRIRELEGLEFLVFNGHTYYPKSKVNFLHMKQQEALRNYYSINQVKKIIPLSKLKHIEKYTPCQIERSAFRNQKIDALYSKKLINSLKEKSNTTDELQFCRDNITHENALESFNNYLGLLGLVDKDSYTWNKWIVFCEIKLKNSKASLPTLKQNIVQLANSSKLIYNIEDEIYNFNSNEISLLLFNRKTPRAYKILYISFIKFYYNQLRVDNLKQFNIEKVNDFYNKNIPFKSKDENRTYAYKTFNRIIQYCKNIELHKERAVNDYYGIINNHERSYYYASFWLYVTIHLNNAWRHEDITELPKIDLSFLENNSLVYYLENGLSSKEIKQVVYSLKSRYYQISKNNTTTYLYCSDELETALATSYVLCFLIAEKVMPFSNKVLYFGTKTNNFKKIAHDFFFDKLEEKNFTFENRKFNRTLLTYVYLILKDNDQENSALTYSQKLRSHNSVETTRQYIDIPKSHLDSLTTELFDRGHFGFIADLFANLVYGENSSREKRTEEISTLNSRFNNPLNIELTSGFINRLVSERKLIIDIILKNGIEETTSIFNRLVTNTLPAKEEHHQCLVGDRPCEKPHLSCKHCPYSVPNFYSLSSITKSIKNLINKINSNYDFILYPAEKTKLSNLLFMEIDLLNYAFKTFGQDIVLSFFKDGKEEYLQLVDSLEDVNEDISLYLTYNPKNI
ncbi:hypothetical protein [Terribacillus saccharophilus]|uniref:hypothetical protein n=1 Tax=Terribacillus saccharophilus TaxID=361277 RepID=UPI000C9B7856|nr:hypothetical protein [Terribacillus goriensis]